MDDLSLTSNAESVEAQQWPIVLRLPRDTRFPFPADATHADTLETLEALNVHLDENLSVLSQNMHAEGPTSGLFNFIANVVPSSVLPVFAIIEHARLRLASIAMLEGGMSLEHRIEYEHKDCDAYGKAITALEELRSKYIPLMRTDHECEAITSICTSLALAINKLEQLQSMHQSYLDHYGALCERTQQHSIAQKAESQAR